MGFIGTGSNGGGGGSSSFGGVIASTNAPSDTTKIWLDLTNGRPVFKKYNSTTNIWEISEGDINDATISERETWSSQQIIENGSFPFTQETPSTEWDITHNLGRIPAVFTMDTSKEEIVGEISHRSLNRLVITFSEPVAGEASLT